MLDNKTKGILFMLISSLGFSFMAVSIKYVSDIPLFEKIFFRNLVSLFVALWGLRHMKSFGVLLGQKGNRRYLIGRSVAGLLGVVTNFYAIAHLPLANANILNKLSPFVVLFLSAYFLKERLRKIQVAGFFVSFLGVMLIIKPTLDFDILPSLSALASAVCAGAAYTFVRALGNRKENPSTIVFVFSLISVLGIFPFMMADFVVPTFKEFLILLSIGVFATFGQFGLTYAYKYSKASEVSIYTYSSIIFTVILGFVFFGEIPDILTVIGGTIVIAVAVKLYYVFKEK